MYFPIENDDLLEKYNTIWDQVSTNIKQYLIGRLSIIKNFWIPKQNLMTMKLQIYDKNITKVHSNNTCLAVISLDSSLKKDENYYPQVFLKWCKYIEKPSN